MTRDLYDHDILLRKTVLFPFFLVNVKLGLAYLSDDIYAKKYIEYKNYSRFTSLYLHEALPGDMNFESLNSEERLLYITMYYRTIGKRHIYTEYEKLLIEALQGKIHNPDLIGINFIAIITNTQENYQFIHSLDVDYMSSQERFIVELLHFHYYSFLEIDFKKAYLHILRSEKIYSDFSQLYALKLRTLYFLYFEKCKLEDKIDIRKNMKASNTVFLKSIESTIDTSHNLYTNNPWIITFQIAYYLHTFDKKGVIMFLRFLIIIKKFRVWQRYALYLWIGKYFTRQRFYKQAYYYLYNASEEAIKEKRLDIDMIKARVHLSIFMKDKTAFDKGIDYLMKKEGYSSGVFVLNNDYKYIWRDGRVLSNINDNFIILPLKDKNIPGQQSVFDEIDIISFQKNEKKLYSIAVIFYDF